MSDPRFFPRLVPDYEPSPAENLAQAISADQAFRAILSHSSREDFEEFVGAVITMRRLQLGALAPMSYGKTRDAEIHVDRLISDFDKRGRQ
jgi:hypothetical protein